ncbi:hypothetical protein PLICRDRAFT_39669 [Plicaturopsis crispa FD-325 SS-3]|nr:hypothetical protein PLICRDRAFT_39669 [Plicaturopsis crispa FD-325 SS-3]
MLDVDNVDWDSIFHLMSSDPVETTDHSDGTPGRDVKEQKLEPVQAPTPPSSPGSTEGQSEEDSVISVSSTFYPGASHYPMPPDLILVSSDSVFFYAHLHVVGFASENGFNSMLPPASTTHDGEQPGPVLRVSESATVLNIVLHAVYDISCAHYTPSFHDLSSATISLNAYGISLKTRIAPTTSLYELILSHASQYPLEVYALASQHDLYDLALEASPHLLSFSLPSLTDAIVQRIHPVYLKRLFFLHLGRADALKRLLLPPPRPHTPTAQCDLAEQKMLTRAWSLAAAYLAWDSRPNLSNEMIESTLVPLGQHLACSLCRRSLEERIQSLVVQWSAVKKTI